MPRDAGRMVSKLTADDRPVFAHRWMVRASDFGPHQFIRGVCPMHSLAANSSASGARRCRLSAPPARSVAYLKFTPVIGASRRLCLRLFRRVGWALDARTLSSRCKLGRGACLLLSDDEVRPHDCCP